MRRQSLGSVVCVLLSILVPTLALSENGLRPPRKALAPGTSAADPGAAPAPPGAPSSELLVGELTCRPDPFGSDTRATFTAHGTIAVQTGGMGELVGRLISTPENPCPGMQDAAASAVQALGCATGLTGNDTLTFVCHDRRERVLEVMAVVSRGVLTGSF